MNHGRKRAAKAGWQSPNDAIRLPVVRGGFQVTEFRLCRASVPVAHCALTRCALVICQSGIW